MTRESGGGPRPFSVSLRLDRRVYSRGGLPQGMGELRGVGRRCFAQSPMRVGPPVKPEGYGFFWEVVGFHAGLRVRWLEHHHPCHPAT